MQCPNRRIEHQHHRYHLHNSRRCLRMLASSVPLWQANLHDNSQLVTTRTHNLLSRSTLQTCSEEPMIHSWEIHDPLCVITRQIWCQAKRRICFKTNRPRMITQCRYRNSKPTRIQIHLHLRLYLQIIFICMDQMLHPTPRQMSATPKSNLKI